MTTAEGFAPAKINLTLHVTGQRADGYHLLDSLVVFAGIGDRLVYEPGDVLSLEVNGPFADGVPTDRRNLVWQAAEMCGWTGRITLTKRLPHGAGIGGGSSDAAAVLRDLGGPSEAALALGADVPVCLSPAPQRMRGIGEVLDPVPGLPAMDVVLVNPGVTVPTGAVFQALPRKDNPPMGDMPTWDDLHDFGAWLRRQRNDLLAPALGLAPVIAEVIDALYASDCVFAGMSGSGATCFGLFPPDGHSAKAAAKAQLFSRHPDWWSVHGRVL